MIKVFKWYSLVILGYILFGCFIYGISNSPLTKNCFEHKCEGVQYLER